MNAADIKSMKEASARWMAQNYYDEWEQAFKAYKCERDPEIDDETGEVDEESTSIGMPDTWSVVRNKAARITANIPNLRVRSADKARAQRVGWKLMRDWDRGGVQRLQARHVTQALIFGWSVRPWSWAIDRYQRTKRVDPMDPNPEVQEMIRETYGAELDALPDPNPGMGVLGLNFDRKRYETEYLLEKHARGSGPPLIEVRYPYTSYEGPRTSFLFVGDCFPEPRFQSLRQSKWFIVQRYRDLDWIKSVSERWPKLQKGFRNMIEKEPNGSLRFASSSNTDEYDLRRRLEADIGRTTDDSETQPEPKGDARQWLIYECHYSGSNSRISYCSQGGVPIGEIEYPYSLDGRIAFTELVLIDDILGGIGDSDARIIRGLQQLHNRAVCDRADLANNVLRPYVWTTNQMFYDDPGSLKRGPGMRVLPPVAGPNEIGIIGEQAAMAAIHSSYSDTQDIQRLIQMATGESNLSNATNNDPQQARTATGARILAYNQDIKTKQLNDAFTYNSLRDDAEMMFLLNRAELSKPVVFDAGPYNRSYSSQMNPQESQVETVTPLDFQNDEDEVIPEEGSTLADDDEAKVQRAIHLYERAIQAPNLINQEKARDELLIAMGKGRELSEWIPAPAPTEPPVEPPRLSVSLAFEQLPIASQIHILMKSGLLPADLAQEAGQEPTPMVGPNPGTPPAPSSGAPMNGGSTLPDMPALNAALGN